MEKLGWRDRRISPDSGSLFQTFLNVTAPLFDQLEDVVYRLQREGREDVLVLSCEPTIAMKWLIPRLPAFHEAHPNLQIQLLAAGGPIDFARSGADLAIRRDDFHWGSSVHSVKICEEWIGPVCTPPNTPDKKRLDKLRFIALSRGRRP